VSLTLDRRRPASRYLAGSLDDAVSVLWRSALGDVRLLVGPADQLERAPQRVVLEGDEHGGYGWDRHGAELLTRDGWALLLVASEADGSLGTYGFSIGDDGSVRPITSAR
jgi:hypothetical protein